MQTVMGAYLKFSKLKKVTDFTKDSVERWVIEGVLRRNWTPKTTHIYLCYLSLFADWCVLNGYLKRNRISEIPRPKLDKKLPECLSEGECERIMKWTRNYPFRHKFEAVRSVAIIATFLCTGLRKSELMKLEMRDVDVDGLELIVRRGKGRKARRIPFRPSLALTMKAYLNERRRLQRKCPYFFTSLRRDDRMGESVLKRLFAKLGEACGIKFHPHLLRHTYATRMLESGLHVREVQELMGHTDIKTTAGYLAVTDTRIKQQVLKLGFDL